MAIKGTSDKRRIPRLGKIHLGIKAVSQNTGKEYPKAVDYFVLPDNLKQYIKTKEPKELDIMFPSEDPDKFAPQFYKLYSSFRGLVCKGDGEYCSRLVDAATGDFAHRDTKEAEWREGLPCDGQNCHKYQAKECKEVMNLQFLIPSVPGLGVWQLDTGSFHSIVQVNSAVDLIKGLCGRVSMIPLKLVVEQKEVAPDDKKKTVNVLNIRTDVKLADIQKIAALPASQVLLPPPDESKPELLYSEDEDTEVPAEPDIPQGAFAGDDEPTEVEAQEQDEPADLTFKNPGEFYTACNKNFKLTKSQADKEIEMYDLTNAKQRKQAWQTIIAVYGRKEDS